MIPTFDTSKNIVVPIGGVEDLDRVGPIANRFADLFGCQIELISILHPEDDFGYEFGRLAQATTEYSQAINKVVRLQVLADDDQFAAFVRLCRDRLVCMATSATPFRGDHYVGSHAAALLAVSRTPAILVGRSVPASPPPADKVVVAIEKSHDSKAALETSWMIAEAMKSPIEKMTIDSKGIIYETDYDDATRRLPNELHACMTSGPIDHDGLCDALAERSERSVLVVATAAKRGLERICDRSVSFDVVDRATGPVVAVGPHADPACYEGWVTEPDDNAWGETSRFIAFPRAMEAATSAAAL